MGFSFFVFFVFFSFISFFVHISYYFFFLLLVMLTSVKSIYKCLMVARCNKMICHTHSDSSISAAISIRPRTSSTLFLC